MNIADKFCTSLASLYPSETIQAVLAKYNDAQVQHEESDPVVFCEEKFGDTYTTDVKRMMRSVWENPVTVAISANATGKTHAAARVAAAFYLQFEDAQVYTAAAPPKENLERLLWGEIGSLTQTHPELFAGHTSKHLHISRGPDSYITGVAIPSSGTPSEREAKFSGKHAPHILFILDEADAIPDEVYKGIESCMSGGWARLLLMYNPRHRSGAPHRMIRDKTANVVHLSAMTHPSVVTGEDLFPGAVNRETVVRRINEWCRPMHEEERGRDITTFMLPDFLVGSTARSLDGKRVYPPLEPGEYVIDEPAFSYMVLGQYPAQASNQLISQEWVNRARSRWDRYVREFGEVPPEIPPIMGLDVAGEGKDLSVAYLRYGGFVPRPKSWGGMDPAVTQDKASAIYNASGAYACNVDATGLGYGVAPNLRRLNCNAYSIMVGSSPTKKTELGEFEQLRDQLLWELREWLRKDPAAMLPPSKNLEEELVVPTYRITDRGKIKVMTKDDMKALLGRSPDELDSLSVTFADPDTSFNPLDVGKCLV